HVSGTKVTDAGLRTVGQLTWLVRLNLAGTRVTDAGLPELRRLADLRELYLNETEVTAVGGQAPQRALPKWKVSRSAAGSAKKGTQLFSKRAASPFSLHGAFEGVQGRVGGVGVALACRRHALGVGGVAVGRGAVGLQRRRQMAFGARDQPVVLCQGRFAGW